MDLNRLPWMNLSHRPLRTAALLVLTFFLSFVIFAGSMAVVSLQNGLGTLENRLGADIIVVPNTAKRKVDPKTMILDGTPGYFYMEREKMVLISHIEGVEKVSPQIFLASLSASCCSVPVQIIGFEPETDFIIQPWIRESYGRELAHGDVVVGSAVNADVGDTIRFYNKDCRIVAKLAAYRFYIIISLFRQQHIIFLKQVFIVFPMEYGFFFLVCISCMNTLAKVSSVMAETDIFAVQIFPCPVKSCQFAVTRILRGNMISCIIRKISQEFFPCCPHMKRYIYIVIGRPVFFMGRYQYLDIHFIFPSLPGQVHFQ